MNWIRAGFLCVCAFLAGAYTLRAPLFSGGQLGVIDAVDGRMMQACWEHIYLCLQGEASFLSPPWFSPAKHTLGYTDTFFLNGLLYSVFRYFDVVPLQAMVATVGCYAFSGFWGFYGVLRKLKLPWGLAAAGAFLFVVGAPIQQAMSNAHLQLLTIWLLPWCALAVWAAFEAYEQKAYRKSFSYYALGLALYCLTAISTFYTAWFALFVGAVVGCIAFLMHSRVRLWVLFSLIPMVWKHKWAGVVVGLGLSVFLYIYLPVRAEMGGRSFGGVFPTLPDLAFFGYNSQDSIFWKDWVGVEPLQAEDKYLHELAFSFPWFFLICWVGAAVLSWRSRFHSVPLYVGTVASFGVLAVWSLMVSVGSFSLWWIVLNIFPGADAIRAVFRINMLLYPLALLSMLLFAKERLMLKIWGRLAISLLFVLFVIEGLIHPKRELLSLEDELVFDQKLDLMRQEVEGLDGFLVVRDLFDGEPADRLRLRLLGTHSLAMRLSQELGIPTMNGYSGQFPGGWHLEESNMVGHFREPLDAWLLLNESDARVGVFAWDQERWDEDIIDFSRLEESGREILPGDSFKREEYAHIFEEGWSIAEDAHRWSIADRARIVIDLSGEAFPVVLKANGSFFHRPSVESVESLVSFGNDEPRTLNMAQGFSEVIVIEETDLDADGRYRVLWEFQNLRSPDELGMSADPRKLGVALNHLSVKGL